MEEAVRAYRIARGNVFRLEAKINRAEAILIRMPAARRRGRTTPQDDLDAYYDQERKVAEILEEIQKHELAAVAARDAIVEAALKVHPW
jgi:hypothetical protein